MNEGPTLLRLIINKFSLSHALIDNGCQCYAAISESLFEELKLPLIQIPRREVRGASGAMTGVFIQGVTYAEVEISGFKQVIYFYVVPMLEHPIILGKPWMIHNEAYPVPHLNIVRHGKAKKDVPTLGNETAGPFINELKSTSLVSGSVFMASVKRLSKQMEDTSSFLCKVSIQDIDKALLKLSKQHFKSDQELKILIPPEFQDLIALWKPTDAAKLPPHRTGMDHQIELKKDSEGREMQIPFGPLYDMSREELLVLRKTLNDLLDKGYIRASKSEAGAPVLFARKPGGGLRFCCDYRGLNAVTRSDRYPLPLISDTIRNLTRAKWFTKLDVVAAFHKIRMKEGEEWKTAFRTRYGLFEWMITPFGLSDAPSTFQRYMNSVLREYLDDFCTAYMDDVLIYTQGTRKEHYHKVRMVLKRLMEAGLYLDIEKCEFAVKSVKYLGFIIQAGIGLQADPAKIKAIIDWMPPTSTSGVRSFIGFANYYRMFIPRFSELAAPLTALTGKGTPFQWGAEQKEAFENLKVLFTRAPILTQWDHEKATFLEANCSGYALGGTLTQSDGRGQRKAVAFHSQKLNPAERNYPIHDKEMLAIIKCLEQWDAEQRSCPGFTILTDHRNLQYFMTRQKLSERQARWAEYLSRFNFKLVYRPGKEAVVPDALSRRDQDKPDASEISKDRTTQMIPENALTEWLHHIFVYDTSINSPLEGRVFEDQELHQLWIKSREEDPIYLKVLEAVSKEQRSLPAELQSKV
ncbi:hypothetical protein K3495_g8215 [Podosphaera aphanis]|nr:hypothetical protein K3495_g8215 [Podosphaera aphanis]